MSAELEELKYPIGRYCKPDSYTQTDMKDWIDVLKVLPLWMDASIENLDVYQLETPYRPGGWNIQQVVHHLADSHMNAYIRLKLALTEDNPIVKPYAEELWAELEDSKVTPVNISVTMLHALHRRMVDILEHLSEDQWLRTYHHPESKKDVPIWEMVALYAWHSKHHTEHIRRLRERMGWHY